MQAQISEVALSELAPAIAANDGARELSQVERLFGATGVVGVLDIERGVVDSSREAALWELAMHDARVLR